MAEGIQLRLTHTGLSASNILIDDIRGESSAGRRGLPPEYVYVPAPTTATPNPQITLTYGGAVPMSFERGDIRGYINAGHLTAEFVLGTLFVSALPSDRAPTLVTTTPFTVLAEHRTLLVNQAAAVATTLVLPPGDDYAGKLWIKDKKGDANLRNITITPDGAETIDGQPNLVLNENYVAIALEFEGTDWSIF